MISIIAQCIGFSTVFLIVYHFWFASKDNQMEISSDEQATQEPLNPNWVEEEPSISNEDLSNVVDQIINEVYSTPDVEKKEEENKEDIIFQDEEQPGFHIEDSGFEGDEIEFNPNMNQEEQQNSSDENRSNKAMEDNDNADEDRDVLETVPSIDYLKES